MKIKSGAKMSISLQDKILEIIPILDRIYAKHGQELVITEGVGGKHMSSSLHYEGLALDIRIRYFDENTLDKVIKDIGKELSEGYQVIVHKTHIHIEWDPS